MASIKMTGAEFRRFYDDEEWWPEGVFHDETIIEFRNAGQKEWREEEKWLDATDQIPDDAEVRITDGYVARDIGEIHPDVIGSFQTYVKRWRKEEKRKSEVRMTIRVPAENADAIREAVRKAGGKIF